MASLPLGRGGGGKETERNNIKAIFDTGWMAAQTKPEMIVLVLERDLFSPGE